MGTSPTPPPDAAARELQALGRDGSQEAVRDARAALEGYGRDEAACDKRLVELREERRRVRVEIRRAERELDRQERAATYRAWLEERVKREEGRSG